MNATESMSTGEYVSFLMNTTQYGGLNFSNCLLQTLFLASVPFCGHILTEECVEKLAQLQCTFVWLKTMPESVKTGGTLKLEEVVSQGFECKSMFKTASIIRDSITLVIMLAITLSFSNPILIALGIGAVLFCATSIYKTKEAIDVNDTYATQHKNGTFDYGKFVFGTTEDNSSDKSSSLEKK
jgi:hypothetical protein